MQAKAMFNAWPTARTKSDTGISQGLPADRLIAMLLKLLAMYALERPTAKRRMYYSTSTKLLMKPNGEYMTAPMSFQFMSNTRIMTKPMM